VQYKAKKCLHIRYDSNHSTFPAGRTHSWTGRWFHLYRTRQYTVGWRNFVMCPQFCAHSYTVASPRFSFRQIKLPDKTGSACELSAHLHESGARNRRSTQVKRFLSK